MKNAIKAGIFLLLPILPALESKAEETAVSDQMHVSAPIDTESAAKGADVAINSVFRIMCIEADSQGTGFLHKSGKILTAAHVVRNCTDPLIGFSNGVLGTSLVIDADPDLDIAIIEPTFPVDAGALPISNEDNLKIGSQVSTWGFPSGYSGLNPMLSVGYLSGVQAIKPYDNKTEKQWVVNAAFNRGNSGGPLILAEAGEVIGVVSSKAAPFSLNARSALKGLKDAKAGFKYTHELPNGEKRTLSEAQVVGMVLEDLQNQVQLVIGNAVRGEDLRAYLKAHGIDP